MPSDQPAWVWILRCRQCSRVTDFAAVHVPDRRLVEWAKCCGEIRELESVLRTTTEAVPQQTTNRIRKIDRLTPGSIAVFTRKPPGSWLTENVPYVIEANGGKTVHFRNPTTGGGTYDTAAAVEQAEFTVHQAAGETTDA